MKKKVFKTTKEFTYDEKGYVIKEVIVQEEYEEEFNDGRIATVSTPIRPFSYDDKITCDNVYTAKGVPPYTTTLSDVNNTCCTPNITVNTSSTKAVNEIANEVKNILDREIKKQSKF